ncbi:MAG: hypothetical protein SVR04_16530, partial [Spirochaetota bacterium]|nr:hypothetical protein [Spirochaetota bacterium]
FLNDIGEVGDVAPFDNTVEQGHFTDIIQIYNPKAFYSVEDVRFVNEGVFPTKRRMGERPLRKGK